MWYQSLLFMLLLYGVGVIIPCIFLSSFFTKWFRVRNFKNRGARRDELLERRHALGVRFPVLDHHRFAGILQRFQRREEGRVDVAVPVATRGLLSLLFLLVLLSLLFVQFGADATLPPDDKAASGAIRKG